MANSDAYFEHTTEAGDRWDTLAYRYYGDATKQSVLLTANRSLYFDPLEVPHFELPPGLILRIPVIDDDQISSADLPPWKRATPDYRLPHETDDGSAV